MQTLDYRDKMCIAQDGWIACPNCGARKLLHVRSDTRAANLVTYCKRCRNEILISLEPEPMRLSR